MLGGVITGAGMLLEVEDVKRELVGWTVRLPPFSSYWYITAGDEST